jgi:AraC-like DNA-binding protein
MEQALDDSALSRLEATCHLEAEVCWAFCVGEVLLLIEHMHDIEHMLFLEPLPELIARLTYRRRLAKTWALVESSYRDADLSLQRAASVSCIHKDHLNVLLRQTTAFTFHQLLVRYRLFKAITMMEAKNYSFLEIALQNGFTSLTTFERNFRKCLGTTPREFKRNSLFDVKIPRFDEIR